MSLRTAIQMDPVHSININGDSTFALGLEAQSRGHELFYYEPKDLSMRDGRVYARARPLTLRREHGNHATLGGEQRLALGVQMVLTGLGDAAHDFIQTVNMLPLARPS